MQLNCPIDCLSNKNKNKNKLANICFFAFNFVIENGYVSQNYQFISIVFWKNGNQKHTHKNETIANYLIEAQRTRQEKKTKVKTHTHIKQTNIETKEKKNSHVKRDIGVTHRGNECSSLNSRLRIIEFLIFLY